MREPQRALADWNRAIELDENCADAYFNRGILLLTLNRLDEGLASLRRAGELGIRDGWLHYNLGWGSAAAGRDEEAVAEFDRALAAGPDDARLLMQCAKSLRGLRRYEQALKFYAAVVLRAPDSEAPRYLRGYVLRELQRFEQALEDYDANLAARPACAHCQAQRARLLANLGRFDEVAAPLGRARELEPKGATVLRCQWDIQRLMGEHAESLETARQLFALNPSTHAHCLVASLRAVGRAEEARKVAEGQAKGDPLRVRRLFFAYVCAAAGNRARAEQALASWDLPWHPFDAHLRARAHAVLGQKQEALAWLGRAADLGLRLPANGTPDPDFQSLAGDADYLRLRTKLTR
jgi:tetratricopeptide (TPR) repeat protein